MKAIYKIENKINNKVYIGQSKNPERRFQEHCKNVNYKSLIYDAIKKYGVNNFNFEILGWYEDYNDKEKYYIKLFNSLAPNGYNLAEGGENPPILSGEKNPFSKITNEVAFKIKQELKNWDIPRRNILKKYKISENILRHINEGTSWFDLEEKYPLRPKESILNEFRVRKVIILLILSEIPLNQIGPLVGYGRSYAKEINSGRNHFNDKLVYPIRKNKEVNKVYLNL